MCWMRLHSTEMPMWWWLPIMRIQWSTPWGGMVSNMLLNTILNFYFWSCLIVTLSLYLFLCLSLCHPLIQNEWARSLTHREQSVLWTTAGNVWSDQLSIGWEKHTQICSSFTTMPRSFIPYIRIIWQFSLCNITIHSNLPFNSPLCFLRPYGLQLHTPEITWTAWSACWSQSAARNMTYEPRHIHIDKLS